MKCLHYRLLPPPFPRSYDPKHSDCDLPAYVGRCRARMRRYFYDRTTGICKLFYYGGCDANANNFRDERACIAKCVPEDRIAR